MSIRNAKVVQTMNSETNIYSRLSRKVGIGIKTKAVVFHGRSEDNADKQFSLLAEAFIKPLIISRSFGNNPLYFTNAKHGNTNTSRRKFIQFEFTKFSLLTAASFIQQLIYIGGFGFLAYRLFHGDYHASIVPGLGLKTKHSATYADGLMTAFVSSFFLACAGGAVHSFSTTSLLSEYLNRWKSFIFEFAKVFHGKYINFRYITRLSKKIGYYTFGLSVLYVTWSCVIYKTCILNSHHNCTWIEREQSFMIAGFGCASILNTTFEQYKLSLMMGAISYSFSQIKDSVRASRRKFSNGKYNLKDLFKLVHFLRRQSSLMNEIFGTTQLLVLFFLFSLSIIVWMMIFQFNAGDISISIVLVVASIGFVQLTRFATVATFSERIVKQERLLVDEISAIELHTAKVQIEVQMFVNLLTKKPSEFTLHNVITWRRSLLLALMSNSTTYLIAITQLLDASNSDTLELSPSSSNFTKPGIPT